MPRFCLKMVFEVRILDPVPQKLRLSEIYEAAKRSDAILMPFSVAHSNDTLRFLEDFQDKIRILTCNFATYIADDLLLNDKCDIVIRGEVEFIVPDILKNLDKLEEVRGIIYNDNGKIIRTEKRPYIEDLDSVPFPARHLLNNKLYTDIFFFGQPTAWILSSRGCPYNCIYCSQHEAYGRRIRYRNPEKVINEMEEIVNKYKIRNFMFFDECFNADNEHATAIAKEIIKRGLKVRWSCGARADLIKAETVRLMKKAGCIEMRIGMESANDEVLKYMQKDITVEEFIKGVEIVKKEKMGFSLHCIFGSPMETEETIKNNLKLIKKVNPTFVSFNILTPLPGSQLYEQYKDKLNLKNMKNFDLVHTDFSICKFSNEELREILRKAYRSFYLRPRFLINYLRHSTKSLYDIYCVFKTSFKQGLYLWKTLFKRQK